jgi:undecaprenyl-diphosphatase
MIINQKLFYFLNSFAGKSTMLDSVFVFFADILPWILIVFTVFYFLFLQKSVKKLAVVTFMIGIASFVTHFLKWQIFLHPRPFMVLPDVVKLINISGFDSFPSGHATVFAALAAGMLIYNKKLGVIFSIFALLIGVARIISGIHYPLDILTGFGIGFVVAILSFKFMTFLVAKVKELVS